MELSRQIELLRQFSSNVLLRKFKSWQRNLFYFSSLLIRHVLIHFVEFPSNCVEKLEQKKKNLIINEAFSRPKHKLSQVETFYSFTFERDPAFSFTYLRL